MKREKEKAKEKRTDERRKKKEEEKDKLAGTPGTQMAGVIRATQLKILLYPDGLTDARTTF